MANTLFDDTNKKMKQHIEQLIQAALEQLRSDGKLAAATPVIQIDATKDKQHGDFASNIALLLAKPMQSKPRDVAAMIMAALPASANVSKVEIAGPGFINFFLTESAFHTIVPDILAAGEKFGLVNIGKGKKVLVEFVSSNPTGPLHVGHGRHAAYGSIVADLLSAVGYDVYREYYVNDAGRQMDILATSVWLRYLDALGETIPFPTNGYKGSYVNDIAAEIKAQHGKDFAAPAAKVLAELPLDAPAGDKELYIDAVIARAHEILGEKNYEIIFNAALNGILADIRNDLEEFGVHYENWFSERELVKSDVVDRMFERLKSQDLAYVREGALWFRSTNFNDEKDRVLERANGQRTYFANDLAYHINKFERGFDTAIDIFGSDHHGYIPRMKAGLTGFGIAEDKLTYLLVQFVTLYRGGEQAQMSTRSGSFVTLRELRDEVGNDAARFFYVMRRSEQHVDFDLDLAKSASNENPVYYIQYAHARICSVHRQLADKNMMFDQAEGLANLSLLTAPQELQLLAKLARYPAIVTSAATQHEPHLLTNYLRDLATGFHTYYNSHQFLVDDAQCRNARLTLIGAVRQILANGLGLLKVSTPEAM
jgi:arginyl-tRNA synthetase